ncbi:Transposable element Tcb1 transposase, partial [Acromyrmex echinatior]
IYSLLLENVMLPYAKHFLGRGFIYQQDNDPKHRAAKVRKWFRQHRVTFLEWPSQSPDLNIIEPL